MRKLLNAVVGIIVIVLLAFFGYDQLDIGSEADQTTEEVASLGEEVTIERVIDGDTVLVKTKDGTRERVRLLLIDTPESVKKDTEVQLFGKEASDFAKQTLQQGDTVILEEGSPNRDQYDRVLAYIWTGNKNFNELMIEKGYARVGYVFEPNTKYLEQLQKVEKQAKEKKLNIWSIDGYVTDRGFDMSVRQNN